MSEPSIFTRIIDGEIPSHKVYEDDKTLVIVDINPVQEGMVVMISKEQVPNYEDLSEEMFQAMASTQRKVMKALRKVFPDKYKIASMVEGLQVQHAHMVMFPFDNHEEYISSYDGKEPDHEKFAELAKRIAKEIE